MSKKFVLQTSEEAVRQKNEDIQTKLDGIEVTLRDIIYNSELQQTLTDYQGAESIFEENGGQQQYRACVKLFIYAGQHCSIYKERPDDREHVRI